MKKNFLITGKPGIGKTTVIRTIAGNLAGKAVGFFTEEIREEGQRVGFSVQTLDGRKGLLAHKRLQTPYRVGRYSVLVRDFELVAVEPLFRRLSEAEILIIDEIGKMELYSARFQEFLLTILEFPVFLIASIMEKSHPLTDAVKARSDVILYTVTAENRRSLPGEILRRIRMKERGKI